MKVINNFLPKKDFDDLTKLVFDKYFPWYFQDEIAFKKEPGEKNGFFTHLIFLLIFQY